MDIICGRASWFVAAQRSNRRDSRRLRCAAPRSRLPLGSFWKLRAGPGAVCVCSSSMILSLTCVRVCVCICMHACIHVHVYVYVCRYVHVYIYYFMHVLMRVHAYAYGFASACACSCIRACRHMFTYTCIHIHCLSPLFTASTHCKYK